MAAEAMSRRIQARRLVRVACLTVTSVAALAAVAALGWSLWLLTFWIRFRHNDPRHGGFATIAAAAALAAIGLVCGGLAAVLYWAGNATDRRIALSRSAERAG